MIAVIGMTEVLLARIVSGRTWRLDLGKQLLLQRQIFQHRLDDIIGIAHRLGEIGARLHPLDRALVIAEIAQIGRDPRFTVSRFCRRSSR